MLIQRNRLWCFLGVPKVFLGNFQCLYLILTYFRIKVKRKVRFLGISRRKFRSTIPLKQEPPIPRVPHSRCIALEWVGGHSCLRTLTNYDNPLISLGNL